MHGHDAQLRLRREQQRQQRIAERLRSGVRGRADVRAWRDRRTRVVDLRGATVVPGLVDLQVNGVDHVDLRDCGPEGYETAALALAAAGATAVQPTLHSMELAGYERALAVLAEVRKRPPAGCRFLPAHLEGPFLSAKWAGAHDPRHLVDPDAAVLDRLLADYQPRTTLGLATCEHLAGTLEQLESLKAGSQEHKRLVELSLLLGRALEESRASRAQRALPSTDAVSALTLGQLIQRLEAMLIRAREIQAIDERVAQAAADDEQQGHADGDSDVAQELP